MTSLDRRSLLRAGAGALAPLLLPTLARAQGEAIRIGVLIPLTGSTSQFGAAMAQAAKVAAEEINAAGGVRGRKVEVLIEDDQSNPEAGLRAARKLIDVDKVVAISGTYASSVTSAVAPLCWESKTVLMTASGADSITKLPHQGYIFRTAPPSNQYVSRGTDLARELGAKRVFFLGPQTPFAQTYIDIITATFNKAGGGGAGIIYEDKKTSYRSEVDQALRFKPDAIIFGGYAPDTMVVLKDLYRANYKGHRIGYFYGVNQTLLDGLPTDVSEGLYCLAPTAAVTSASFKRLGTKMKSDNVDSYSCQLYDDINLIALALAGAPPSAPLNGQTVRDNIRGVTQDAKAKPVDSVADGLKLLAAGTKVNYDGASGPLEFETSGENKANLFRFDQVRKGKLVTTKIA
jgi:branched-chain amino acid transport system substrate-binding protein